jgi:ketosteroid isomerase-like protein
MTSLCEQARETVMRFYAGGARGEITSFRDSLAEDFELFVPPQLPWGGTFDKEQYVALLPRVAAVLDFARLTYISLTAEGAHVVALIKIGVQGTDGSIINAPESSINAVDLIDSTCKARALFWRLP